MVRGGSKKKLPLLRPSRSNEQVKGSPSTQAHTYRRQAGASFLLPLPPPPKYEHDKRDYQAQEEEEEERRVTCLADC